MVKTNDGKKLHLLGEVKDGVIELVAFKYYNRRLHEWVYELKPKSELEK
ncbi:hypothetical protein REA38_11585 [Serratia sp. MF2]|nr:hypothetical protein [Serratia sp. MF1(2023)]MDQ7104191.1 hypothetical protein [Serratia sp. MF1(2023)]